MLRVSTLMLLEVFMVDDSPVLVEDSTFARETTRDAVVLEFWTSPLKFVSQSRRWRRFARPGNFEPGNNFTDVTLLPPCGFQEHRLDGVHGLDFTAAFPDASTSLCNARVHQRLHRVRVDNSPHTTISNAGIGWPLGVKIDFKMEPGTRQMS